MDLFGKGSCFMEQKEDLSILFSHYKCALFDTRNRVVRSATWLAEADDSTGALTQDAINKYAQLASGGVGTIITGLTYVERDGRSYPRQCGLDCDEKIGDYQCLVNTVHARGARLIVQLSHGGSNKLPDVAVGTKTLSPSGKHFPGTDLMSLKMTGFEIKKMRRAFANAASRVVKSGADGIEIQACHGFLLAQFMSPILNTRDDRYGGTRANRERIFFEVYDSVRKAVGVGFPIFFKLSISEEFENGYTAEDGLHLAKGLLKAGVDGIEVSNGSPYSPKLKQPSMVGIKAGKNEAPSRDYASELKKFAGSNQPIILCGGIRSPQTIAELIHSGACDMVSLSRPFNREPELVNRWQQGNTEPAKCVSCNACFGTASQGMIYCPLEQK